MTMNNQERAAKLFSAIKKELTDKKKKNASDKRFACQQTVALDYDYGWNGKDASVSLYPSPSRKSPAGFKGITEADVKAVFRELIRLIEAQKKVRGWSGLYLVHPGIRYGGVDRNSIDHVGLANAPCKEFESLRHYVNKFGSGARLNPFELYTAGMGGKRGYLWDEYGERYFLDNNPKRCANILASLRATRSSKDTMTCQRGHEDYIDPIDKQYSEKHELECDGVRREYIEIVVKTPSGKEKLRTRIC